MIVAPSPAAAHPAAPPTTPALPFVEELLVVDLASAGAALPVLRRLARRAAERAGAAGRVVLYDVPDGETFECGGEATVLGTADLLRAEGTAAVQRWIDSAARLVVDGPLRDAFPQWRGVHLAELNRLNVQVRLTTFAMLAGGLAHVAASRRVRRCVIVSGTARRAHVLADFARACGIADVRLAGGRQARVVDAVRRARRLLAPSRGDAHAAPDMAPAMPAGPVTGLLVSESTPQAHMFEPVERALRAAGEGTWLRAQYGPARETRADGVVTVVAPGRPLVVPARRRGRFTAGAHALRRRRLHLEVPLFGHALSVPWQDVMRVLYDEVFDGQAEHLDDAAALLERVEPSLVVVGNDRWWVGLAYVLLARHAGLPTLCLQDGLAGDIAYWWWIGADRWAANGDEQRDIMMREGVDGERLVVTGQPRYDDIFERADAAATRRRMELPADATVALFATQPHQNAAYAAAVVGAVASVPDMVVALRPHPSEPADKYDAVVHAHPAGRVRICRGGDVFDAIAAADLLVTEFSTVALEAALLGRPVLTATFAARPVPVDFVGLGIAMGARSPEALARNAAALAAAPARAAQARAASGRARELVGPTDGRSAERVVALMQSMLPAASAAR